MAWACVYSCHQCFALMASVNSVNVSQSEQFGKKFQPCLSTRVYNSHCTEAWGWNVFKTVQLCLSRNIGILCSWEYLNVCTSSSGVSHSRSTAFLGVSFFQFFCTHQKFKMCLSTFQFKKISREWQAIPNPVGWPFHKVPRKCRVIERGSKIRISLRRNLLKLKSV